MGITKIAYFVYFVKDMARAIAFYRDVLQLPVGYETTAWVQFKVEGGTLALHLADPDREEDYTNAHGGGMVGFVVEDMDAYAQYLRTHNVSLQGDIREEHFGRLLNITDPDGNVINLFQPVAMVHGKR
jgi:catechol 2,3-dioxygenase-like lactoylglutathione lyase family enzyme